MKRDCEKLVLKFLKEHPEGLTIKDLARLSGFHRDTVTKYVYKLIGVVARNGYLLDCTDKRRWVCQCRFNNKGWCKGFPTIDDSSGIVRWRRNHAGNRRHYTLSLGT